MSKIPYCWRGFSPAVRIGASRLQLRRLAIISESNRWPDGDWLSRRSRGAAPRRRPTSIRPSDTGPSATFPGLSGDRRAKTNRSTSHGRRAIRGGGRNVLFDTDFHREAWINSVPPPTTCAPTTVKLAGVSPTTGRHRHQPCPWVTGRHRPLPKRRSGFRSRVRLLHGDAGAGRSMEASSRRREGSRATQHEGRLRLVAVQSGDHSGIRATPERGTRGPRSTRVEGDSDFVLASDTASLPNLPSTRRGHLSEADQPAKPPESERMIELAAPRTA